MKIHLFTIHPLKKNACLIAGLVLLAGLTIAPAQSDLDLSLTTYAGLSLTGTVGRMYQIQYSSDLTGPDSWRALMHFELKWNPQQWVDTTQPMNGGQRFYRAVPVDVPGGVTPVANMVFIPPGTFIMGSPATEPGRWDDEGPQTLVTLTRAYWIGKFEVTQGEYLALMGNNPAFFNGIKDWPNSGTDYGADLTRPVESVSWNDAVAYCAALTAQERSAGRLPAGFAYRLPTEAQWEYACRAGTTTAFSHGDTLRSGMQNFNGLHEYPPCHGESPRYCENPGGAHADRPLSVGSFTPNAWGLYDMHGNVWEWCQDYSALYTGTPATDPQGPVSGLERIDRGGGWFSDGLVCRSALRGWNPPESTYYTRGFRVVLTESQ